MVLQRPEGENELVGEWFAEVHQVGSHMIHLVRESEDESGEYLGLIEGGGVYLTECFLTLEEVDTWLHQVFFGLFPDHCCGLGCIGIPGSHFLAEEEVLERLAGLEPYLG